MSAGLVFLRPFASLAREANGEKSVLLCLGADESLNPSSYFGRPTGELSIEAPVELTTRVTVRQARFIERNFEI